MGWAQKNKDFLHRILWKQQKQKVIFFGHPLHFKIYRLKSCLVPRWCLKFEAIKDLYILTLIFWWNEGNHMSCNFKSWFQKAKDARKKRKNVKLCFPRLDLLGHQFETLARARRMGDIFFKDRQNIFIFRSWHVSFSIFAA